MNKPLLTIALALAGAAMTVHARADILDVTFSGAVSAQVASGHALGDTVSGQFLLDTSSGSFLSFTVDGHTAAAGFTPSVSFSAGNLGAFYQEQLSAVPTGSVNSSVSVDLESLNNPWTGADPIALLQDSNQLATNLDTPVTGLGLSQFSYYTGTSGATAVQSLTATLTSLQVTTVPEPGSYALMLAGLVCIGAIARRRGTT